jgi:light-regulated signal transduction histidine kinase (bacteriophytochrome)
MRRHLRSLRSAVEKASGDGTFGRRLEPLGGESGPLVDSINSLLAQIQSREADLLRRTYDLENANRDLESFAHTISHDLRGPLGSVLGFAEALGDVYGNELDAEGREYIRWILESSRQMQSLIDGLLGLSRLSRAELHRQAVDLSAIAAGIATSLTKATPEREVEFRIRPDVVADGDELLLRAVLENLIANAWKFTGKNERAVIEFGMAPQNGHKTFFVRDNGAGFDPTQASKMFRPFQRLHSAREFEGTGIGLATVQRILQRHGGKAWAEGEPGQGATIFFTTG